VTNPCAFPRLTEGSLLFSPVCECDSDFKRKTCHFPLLPRPPKWIFLVFSVDFFAMAYLAFLLNTPGEPPPPPPNLERHHLRFIGDRTFSPLSPRPWLYDLRVLVLFFPPPVPVESIKETLPPPPGTAFVLSPLNYCKSTFRRSCRPPLHLQNRLVFSFPFQLPA